MSIIDTCSIQCWLFIELFYSNLEKTFHFLSLLCHLVDPVFYGRRSSHFHFEGEELQDAGSDYDRLVIAVACKGRKGLKDQTTKHWGGTLMIFANDKTRYIKRLFSPNKNMARFDVEILQQRGAFGLLHHRPSPHRQRGESTEVDGISYGKWDLFPSRRKTLRGETTTEQMFWADFVCLKY